MNCSKHFAFDFGLKPHLKHHFLLKKGDLPVKCFPTDSIVVYTMYLISSFDFINSWLWYPTWHVLQNLIDVKGDRKQVCHAFCIMLSVRIAEIESILSVKILKQNIIWRMEVIIFWGISIYPENRRYIALCARNGLGIPLSIVKWSRLINTI